LIISDKSPDYLDKQCQEQAENNHGSDWKIEPEVFFLYPYITRQAANPMQFIMKEIDDYTGKQDEKANNNDPFSCIAVHDAKIRLINEAKRNLHGTIGVRLRGRRAWLF